jgi:hypothetical protein
VNFRVLSVARLEAADAALWYESRRVGLGDEFLTAVEEAFHRIREAPLAYATMEHCPAR